MLLTIAIISSYIYSISVHLLKKGLDIVSCIHLCLSKYILRSSSVFVLNQLLISACLICWNNMNEFCCCWYSICSTEQASRLRWFDSSISTVMDFLMLIIWMAVFLQMSKSFWSRLNWNGLLFIGVSLMLWLCNWWKLLLSLLWWWDLGSVFSIFTAGLIRNCSSVMTIELNAVLFHPRFVVWWCLLILILTEWIFLFVTALVNFVFTACLTWSFLVLHTYCPFNDIWSNALSKSVSLNLFSLLV